MSQERLMRRSYESFIFKNFTSVLLIIVLSSVTLSIVRLILCPQFYHILSFHFNLFSSAFIFLESIASLFSLLLVFKFQSGLKSLGKWLKTVMSTGVLKIENMNLHEQIKGIFNILIQPHDPFHHQHILYLISNRQKYNQKKQMRKTLMLILGDFMLNIYPWAN